MKIQDSNNSYVDHLNTPRLIADDQQRTVWRWDQTDPFGGNPPDENPSGLGVFEFPLRLPGQYFDKETNLHYNYFRDYDPGLGRYAEADALGVVVARLPTPTTPLNHLYAYVGSSPIFFEDPLGLLQLPNWLRNWGSQQGAAGGAGAVLGGKCAQRLCKRNFGVPASEADATQECADLMDASGLKSTLQSYRVFATCRDTCMELTKNCKAMPVSLVQPIAVVQCQ